MNNTEKVFLESIIAEPGVDDLRLIFADWLDENGQPERGEFIRVQCELARTDDPHGDTYWDGQLEDEPEHYRRRKALRRRERELLDRHGWAWAGKVFCQLYPITLPMTDAFTFRRGFVASVRLTLADWCGTECSICDGQGKHRYPYGNLTDPCGTCHGTRRVNAHGPALVRATPLERVTLTEWGGENCRHCSFGCVPTDRNSNTCEVCHGLYDSAAALNRAHRHS